ncbi:MAG: DoxX family protein [Desulfuromonas sp.]|nr:MAG: DoxX family protein [Desulfuromonas sp.]
MSAVQRFLYHLTRLSLAGVFIYAGAVKSTDISGFAGQVAGYRMLPYAANYLVAATLPYVEVLAGLLLLLNLRARPALIVLGAMLLVFTVALATVVIRGLEIDCGCFSPGEGEVVSAKVALLRDAGLLVLVAICWWLRGCQPQSADQG